MSESIKLEVTATGKASIDSTLNSLDELQQKLSGLGRNTGGMRSLQAELDRLKLGFASVKGVGGNSLQELEAYGKRLGSALDSISRVVSSKKISPQYAAQLTDFAQMIKLESEHTISAIKEGSAKLARAAAEAEVAKAAAVAKLRSATLAGGGQTGVASAVAGLFSQPQPLPQSGVTALLAEIKAGTVAIGRAYEDRAAAVKATTPTLVRSYAQQGSAVVNQIRENALAALVAQTKAAEAAALAQREINRYIAKPSPSNYARQDRVDNIFARAQAVGPTDVNPQTLQASTAARTALNNAMQQGTNHATLLGSAVKQLTVHHQDLNSAMRGLAQGFGVISAGLSNMVPLISSFAIASAFVKTLKVGAEFEKSMFTISELAGTASSEMVGLRERVLQLGASTQYGPLEVAKGLEVLTLAGLSAKEAVQAVGATLQFAAAGDLPLQSAAETLVAVGTAYRFGAESYSVVADVIAKTAAETMASVQAMAESFKTSSVVAQQYGISLGDTAAALGALAQIGIKGTAAGTSFRNMVTELNKGSGKAAEGVRELGVQIQELDGSMRPVMAVMKDLAVSLSTKTGAAQQRLLQDMTNERGAKALAAFQAEALSYIAKVNPGLQQQADELFNAGKILAGNKVLTDAVADAFDKMAEKAKKMQQSAQGFTFFAALEQSLTPLGQYKGILASLEVDFIKAFNSSSDAVYVLGARLREIFNSTEFQSGLTSLVSGIAAVASGVVDLTKWVIEHREAVLLLAGTYLVLSTNMLRGLAIGGASAALSAIATGVSALTAATTGLTTAAGLVAAAKLVWASATTTLAGVLAGAQTVATGFWTALLAIPAAMLAIGAAITAVVVGLGYLAYRWATAADSAEESAKKQRQSLLDSLKTSIEANKLKNASVASQVSEEIAEKEKLVTAMRNGLTQEEAANKVMGEMALLRIETTHREIMLQMALNAVKAKGSITAGTGHIERKALEADIDSKLKSDVLAQERAMNSELAKQVTQTEKLRRLNSELAGWAHLRAEQNRLVGRDDKGGFKGKPDPAKLAAAREEHNTLRGLIAETHGFEKLKMQEVASMKAALAQDNARLLQEEKVLVAQLTEAYAAGVAKRKADAVAVNVAVADGVLSELNGLLEIARLQRENHTAELQHIAALTEATAARLTAQKQLAEEVWAAEALKLAQIIEKQADLVAKLEKKKGSSEYSKEYETELAKLRQLQEAYVTFGQTVTAVGALQTEIDNNAISGKSKLIAATNAQTEALDAQYEAAKKELKLVKDGYRDRAKGAAEMARHAAERQEALAEELEGIAAILLSYGDLTAAEAVRQAAIARTRSETMNLKLAVDAAMSVDWYAASTKALKDYASSLENVAGEIANVFTKSFKGLEDVIVDFITKGKADFKGFVSSILSDMARIAVRQNIIMPMLNWMTGGSGGGGGGQSLGGMAMSSMAGSAGNSMLSAGANTVGGWLGLSGGAGAGSAFASSGFMGTTASTASGAFGVGGGMGGASGLAEMATGASAASTGTATAAAGGSSVLTAIPVWGWIALAAIAIASKAKGETRSGGQYSYDNNSGVASLLQGPSGGEIEGSTVKTAISGTAAGINGLLKGMGSTAVLTGFQAGLESSDRGRGGVFSGGTLSTGATFGESGKGNNYEGTLYEQTSSHSVDSKTALENFTTDLMQGTIQALQAATDIPKTIADMLEGVDAESLSKDAATALVTTIQTTVSGVASLKDAMETMNLKALSFDAAASLIKAAGGIDKLGASLATYYDKFYSAEEKAAASTKNVATAFSKLGITMPAVNSELRAWYRGQVESALSLDQTIAANAEATAGVLALAGAVDSLSPASASAVSSMKDFVSNVMSLVNGIHESVSGSIFDMKYGLQDNQGKYGMLDTVAKGYDDKMRSATDIGVIAEMAQKEIDTINKAWDLLDAEQQAAKLGEMVALLEKVDTFVTQSGADAISLKKAENQDLADTIATAVEDALADLTTRLADAAIAQAAATSQFAEAKSTPAQVNVTVNNRSSSEVSIS